MAEDFGAPQSRNEALLQNILGANNVILPPESRNEKLLQAILGVEGVEPELPPQSVIEDLLLQIKEQGIGGGDSLFISLMNKTVTEIRAEELDGLISLKSYAFSNCRELTSISFPQSLKWIGAYAFKLCTKISSILLPEGLEVIGTGAFRQCISLTSVSLPSQITRIPQEAFDGCISLKTVDMKGEVYAIADNSALYGAFAGCSNLETVICRATSAPTLGANAFYGCSNLKNIYVPSSSVDTYKAANNWANYAAIINPIPEGI